MIVVDTHAWVWWTTESGELSRVARERLDSSDEVAVPAIACWEVAMLVEKGRLRLDCDVLEFLREALSWERVRLVPLTPEIAVRSTRLGPSFPGDPADKLIVATAADLNAPLVTADQAIRGFPGVVSVW